MKAFIRISLVVSAAGILLGIGSGTTAADEDSAREAVLEYWTAERMESASPVGVLLDEVAGVLDILPRLSLLERQPGSQSKPQVLNETDGTVWAHGGPIERSVGKVFFTLDGRDNLCTATLVKDFRNSFATVVTAGHCVYDPDTGEYAENWVFIPEFSQSGIRECDQLTLGCWTADHFVTSRAFANGDIEGDYAFAVLGPGGRDGETQLEEVADPRPIVFEREHPDQVHAFGYPSSEPFDGTDLAYCAGITVTDNWGGTGDYGVECTMNTGASGGPWLVDFNQDACSGAVNSVTSFRYAAGTQHEYLFGPYFGVEARQAYVAAQSSTGNLIVD